MVKKWSSTHKKYADEHTGKKIQDIWDYIDPAYPLYPTEKNHRMLEMIVAQSSNENSYVLDCFAGSGSTLLAASKLGRKCVCPKVLELLPQDVSTFSGMFDRLGLFEMGENGTCIRKIAEFPLPN